MDERFVKKCRVCGDKALSFNFNGLCCESCKIFFRRNALKYDEFKCYHGGNCPIDIVTRKTCQLCRLNKCFAIGMRKELIVTKGAKSSGNASPTSSTVTTASTGQSSASLTGKSVLLSELLQAPCDVEMGDEEKEEEDELMNNKYKKIKLNKEEIKEEDVEEGEEIPMLDAFGHRSAAGGERRRSRGNNILINQSNGSQSSSMTAASYLKPYESHCLEVIKKVTMIFHEAAPPMKNVQIIGYATSLVQMFNNQEAHIQNMLAFTNSIGGFQSLAQQDQLVMFKAAFPEILLLRSAFFFNFEKNAFLTRLSQLYALYVKLDMLYFGPNREDTIRLHRKLAFKVKEEMEDDTIVRDLVSVLIMFKPKDSITCPEYIRYQYFSYCHLLRKYLQFKYQNTRKATEKYFKLSQIVQDIGFIKQNALNVVSRNVDPTKVSDVLTEIYYPEKNQQSDQQSPNSHDLHHSSNQSHQMAQQSQTPLHNQHQFPMQAHHSMQHQQHQYNPSSMHQQAMRQYSPNQRSPNYQSIMVREVI